MAKWKYKIDVKDIWRKAKAGEVTVQELSADVAQKLKALPVYKSDPELKDIVDEFESLAEDKLAEDHEFDDVWERLYEWGDITIDHHWPTQKMCWIATI